MVFSSVLSLKKYITIFLTDCKQCDVKYIFINYYVLIADSFSYYIFIYSLINLYSSCYKCPFYQNAVKKF